ncbi:MAG TPA: DUF983 domain-containing protein [Acetobacteraceae bacterium]|jgi:uncharacterized protein (DUF983 family)|nr:DUF983 domain-containing protein [Acetobacteraceae bacterium]
MLDTPTTTTRWEPDRKTPQLPWAALPLSVALARGFMCRCPMCGRTHLFQGYLRVVKQCSDCGAPLGLVRADDAPPYFTIFAVGHMIVPAMLLLERTVRPPLWVHTAIWVPLALGLSLVLLRPIKGATVGLMLKLGMMKSDDERDG